MITQKILAMFQPAMPIATKHMRRATAESALLAPPSLLMRKSTLE